MRTELSHRERVRLALQHRETDRVPIAMVCSGINAPAREALEQMLRRDRGLTVEAYLDPLLDIRDVHPRYIGPALPPGTDLWGVRRRPVSYGLGAYDEIEHHPLADAQSVDDIRAHRFPSTAWFEYESLEEQIRAMQARGDFCLMASNGNIFESSWYMRGFERIFMDLAEEPELAHAIFEPVTEFYIEHFRKLLGVARGRVDLVFTADDIGGQGGLLMSPAMWRKHIFPYHQRLNRVLHEFGVKVIYHSDGAIMEAVPGLIEMGIDVLQALQFDAAGMDAGKLKADFGDRLCFEGGISVQKTLPFGRPEDVRQEVVERIRILGRNGGYILGPSHAIQAGTPPENIVALFDTAAQASAGKGR